MVFANTSASSVLAWGGLKSEVQHLTIKVFRRGCPEFCVNGHLVVRPEKLFKVIYRADLTF